MRDKIKFDKSLTIDQMADEAKSSHPELGKMDQSVLRLTIARYLSSTKEWNYTAERFNYLKSIVDRQYNSLEAKGKVTAKEVSDSIGIEDFTPRLVSFLHHHDNRDVKRHTKKKQTKSNQAQISGNVKTSDEQVLSEIISRYHPDGLKTFDCDLTYGEGAFYRHIPQPKERYDTNPTGKEVHALKEIEDLTESRNFKSIVIDLPDMVISNGKAKGKSEEKSQYAAFRSLTDLYESYADMIWLAQFHLANGGILVFKAPDILIRETGQYYENMWTADYAVDLASSYNLALLDEILLVEDDDLFPNGTSLTTLTRHGKRMHVFLIFKKL